MAENSSATLINPVGGRRFHASDNPNRYLAFYDLTAPDVLDHPDCEKYRTSPCTERIAKHFTFRQRNIFIDITPRLLKN